MVFKFAVFKFAVRKFACRLFVLSLFLGSLVQAQDSSAETDFAALIQSHCIKCHGAGDEREGDVDLSEFLQVDDSLDIELASQVIAVLDANEMPPEDEPAVEHQQRGRLVSHLKRLLEESLGESATYSPTPIRRMNRFQYNNAVVDLFDLKCIVFTLPERMMREHRSYFKPETEKMADVVTVGSRPLGKSQMIEPRLAGVAAFPQDLRAEHGFDNRGDHLSLSPLLMESFLKLSQSITNSPDFAPQNVGIWKTFFDAPADDAAIDAVVRERLQVFLTRAFRRPVSAATLDRYAQFVIAKIDSGTDFTQAMKIAASAALSSPKFLYLHEEFDEQSGLAVQTQRISDLELASRMSFFLWGSLPDQELIDLAVQGKLSSAAIAEQQVDRMLLDRKVKRFCDSFPAQWLQLERIISSVPDMSKFPQFYFSKYRDSMHMMLEPLLLFETVLIENRPVHELVDSPFTYRSMLLEQAYAGLGSYLPGDKRKLGDSVQKLNFLRMPVKDRRTGGVITNAAVMTMTSGPERTKPITRGAWVATVIFNDPPEPPPADVPPLDEKPPAGEEDLTLRERLSKHRERADCKGCHEQIDPLGFALENFDAIGQWRDKYDNDRDVDMQGTLLRTHDFDDVIEFKDAILLEKDRFVRALAGHLLSFALARELGAADQVSLDQITLNTVADDYKMKTLLKQIVLSKPFQTKTNRPNAKTSIQE